MKLHLQSLVDIVLSWRFWIICVCKGSLPWRKADCPKLSSIWFLSKICDLSALKTPIVVVLEPGDVLVLGNF